LRQSAAGSPVSPEAGIWIDFNLHRMPRLLGRDVPDGAAAAILGISTGQFRDHVAAAQSDVRQTASDLLSDPLVAKTIDRLPIPPGGTLLALGDSITAYRRGYVEILRALLDLRRPGHAIQVLNMGESGCTSAAGREIAYTQCLARRPDMVLVKLGVNDCKRFGGPGAGTLVSPAEYRRNMEDIVSAFVEHTRARLVLLTPAPVPESLVNGYGDFVSARLSLGNADIVGCADVLRSIAAQAAVPLVDLVSLFGMAPDAALYTPEGLHPGPLGHRLIVTELLRVLQETVVA